MDKRSIQQLEKELKLTRQVANAQAEELMLLRGETEEDYIADDAPCTEEEAGEKLQDYVLAKLDFIAQASRRIKERCEDDDTSEEMFKAIMDAVNKGWKEE